MKKWLHNLLTPGRTEYPRSGLGILILLALSLTALLMAPLLMPEDYAWRSHTISESAAQGLEGAWLSRLGFLLLGFAVLWLSQAAVKTWARAAVWMHASFGIFMIATAAFSHHPFIPGVTFDPFEDLLHSFTATGMGFAFSLGVAVCLFQRRGHVGLSGVFDLLATASAVGIPLLMAAQPAWAGLAQRLMFLVAYAWYGKEAFILLNQQE